MHKTEIFLLQKVSKAKCEKGVSKRVVHRELTIISVFGRVPGLDEVTSSSIFLSLPSFRSNSIFTILLHSPYAQLYAYWIILITTYELMNEFVLYKVRQKYLDKLWTAFTRKVRILHGKRWRHIIHHLLLYFSTISHVFNYMVRCALIRLDLQFRLWETPFTYLQTFLI